MTQNLSRSDLRRAQKWVVGTLQRPWAFDPKERLPGVILAWDMGGGKTVSVLTALRDLLDRFLIRKAIVFAPVLVAKTTWPDEIEKWSHTRPLSYTVLRAEPGDPAFDERYAATYELERLYSEAKFEEFRTAALATGLRKGPARAKAREKIREAGLTPGDIHRRIYSEVRDAHLSALAAEHTEIHIANKELLPWLWRHYGNGALWPYDVIILDDVRETKSGKKRSTGTKKDGEKAKAPLSRFGILAALKKKSDAIIQMTGTPTPRSIHNLWGQLYLVDLGERLGSTKTAFERRWFKSSRYSYGVEPLPHAHDEIMDLVRDVMFSLNDEDKVELPPIIHKRILVDLPKDVLAAYKQFKRDLVSTEYDIEAVNRGVLHGKLLQFANGSLYRPDKTVQWVHDCKLDALGDIIDEVGDEPVLVAYSFKFDLARIRKRYPHLVVFGEGDARETKARWNRGEIPIMAAHPASAGHGTELQFGGHVNVWCGLTSDLELFQQFNKRLHRYGQTQRVVNYYILARGTIDERLEPVYLDPKAATQTRVLDAVRVELLSD